MSAMFIDYECKEIQERFIDTPENGDGHHILPSRVHFLVCYYYGYGKILRGTYLQEIVQREYCRTLTNAVVAYRNATGKDLSVDIQEWTSMYNR